MGSVISFDNIIKTGKENEKLLSGFEETYSKLLESKVDEIKQDNIVSNFNTLYDNYLKIMNNFKRGAVPTCDVKKFLEKMNAVLILEREEDSINYIYSVLYFFYSYNKYGNEFLDLSDSDIRTADILFSAYEEEEKLENIEDLLDGIFNDELINKLKDYYKDEEDVAKTVAHSYSVPYDMYLEKMYGNMPFEQYLKRHIKKLEDSKKIESIPPFSRGILTPELVYENINGLVSFYIDLLYTNSKKHNDVSLEEEANELEESLDSMVLKLKHIEEPERTNCLIFIRNVWLEKKIDNVSKISLTFKKIQNAYEKTQTNSKNKK